MINQNQLEELVREVTIGSGDVEISITNLIKIIQSRVNEELSSLHKKIIAKALSQCQHEFYNP